MFPLIPSYPHMTWMIWSAQFVSSKLDIMVHLDLRLHVIIIQEICCPHHMAFLTSGTLFGSSPPIEIHFYNADPTMIHGKGLDSRHQPGFHTAFIMVYPNAQQIHHESHI